MHEVTTSTLGPVREWDERERATLVALLRTRPSGMTWQQVVQKILEAGSARDVWEAMVEQSLFDAVGGFPDPIAEAARDIAAWRADRHELHTFRDSSFPAQLREIHEVPPVLFSTGTLVPDEPAVSLVGSRRASVQGLRWAGELDAAAGRHVLLLEGTWTSGGHSQSAALALRHAGAASVAILVLAR